MRRQAPAGCARRAVRRTLSAALAAAGAVSVALTLVTLAHAGPPLEDALGPATVAPPKARQIPWLPPAAPPENPEPEYFVANPTALAEHLARDPERLAQAAENPELALSLAQLLLRANRPFLVERLLERAAAQAPERTDLARARARVLLNVGRPAAAQRLLEAARERSPGDPTLHYLLGRAWLSYEPRTPEADAAALRALETVLELDPGYADPEGVTATEIIEVRDRLRASLKK